MRSTAIDIFLQLPQVQDAIRDARRDGHRDGHREARREAHIQILRDQLKRKFRTLPAWADEKLESATSVQARRWLKKIFTAETIEGVLGKKYRFFHYPRLSSNFLSGTKYNAGTRMKMKKATLIETNKASGTDAT